jgi:hypothetical protein
MGCWDFAVIRNAASSLELGMNSNKCGRRVEGQIFPLVQVQSTSSRGQDSSREKSSSRGNRLAIVLMLHMVVGTDYIQEDTKLTDIG